VPQVPLDPFQILEHLRAQLVALLSFADFLWQALCCLSQDRQAHRQMEPVQQVFSLRVEVELHVAYVLAAVGEKLYLLILLHALALEQLKETTLWFFIIGLNPGKTPS